jgi:hypothetical protein
MDTLKQLDPFFFAMLDRIFPEEIKIGEHKLKRKGYLLIGGLVLLLIVILGFSLNKRAVQKQIESYMKMDEE